MKITNLDILKNLKRISRKELAEMLGISLRTVYNYEAKGILKARKTPTNRAFFLESDIEQYIENRLKKEMI